MSTRRSAADDLERIRESTGGVQMTAPAIQSQYEQTANCEARIRALFELKNEQVEFGFAPVAERSWWQRRIPVAKLERFEPFHGGNWFLIEFKLGKESLTFHGQIDDGKLVGELFDGPGKVPATLGLNAKRGALEGFVNRKGTMWKLSLDKKS